MDMQVDIDVLNKEKKHLEQCSSKLRSIVDSITKAREQAAESLEGNQFDISSSMISSTVKSVEDSINYMSCLSSDIDKLIEIVNKYLSCKYGG